MTYAAALKLARERANRNGNPGSTELYKLLARNPTAYQDYLEIRDRLRDGGNGEPAAAAPVPALTRAAGGQSI